MNDDTTLLRRYVQDADETGFSELVQRHIGLVYTCAFRRVGRDAHLAEDVTQKVFCDLARKAPQLTSHPALAGWLFASTQYTSAATVRAERRRKARETQATLMENMLQPDNPESATDWGRLRPLLDTLLMELKALDRDAVLLRFFEKRSFADVAATLHLTEDGARKRVERSIEKLRGKLTRHGVTSSTAVIALALGADSGVIVPSALAADVAGVALAGAASAGAGASTLATLGSAITSAHAAVVASLLAGAGLVAWQHHANATLEAQAGNLPPVSAQAVQALQRENLGLSRNIAEAEALRQLVAAESATPPAPAAAPAPAPVPSVPVNITVTAAGTLLWNNERISLDTYLKRLADLQSQSPDQSSRLVVQSVSGGYFGATDFVVEQASKAGIKDIEIISDVRPAASQNWITTAAKSATAAEAPAPSIAGPVGHP